MTNAARIPAPPVDATVLVIDDEPDLRTLYELTLLREGYRVEAAATLAEAREQLQRRGFQAVISDMRLPDGSGLEVLEWLRNQARPERCIVMTAYGSAENAVEALKCGAFDYLTKPVDLKQFRSVVAAAIHSCGVAGGVTNGTAVPATPGRAAVALPEGAGNVALARLVGDSGPMRLVKQRIAKVARSMAPVLVRGESGTGKELVARALHASSHRADGPLIAVNCGAIPENLLEAEFFGARKGSYTGAAQDREGYFQAARGGTLFLDEIGDLPLAMQSKLLRAIQERSVRPLGSTQEDAVDVRIVSATHKDLAADVQAGRFRQDLFYRLNVIEIAVPPLRDRREDLPALCDALLRRIAEETGMPSPQLSAAAREQLALLPLPGNVRELENLLHRAVALSEADTLQLDAVVPPSLTQEAAAAYAAARSAASLEPVPTTEAAPGLGRAADVIHGTGVPSGDSAAGWARMQADPDLPLPHDLQGYLDALEREILARALRENRFNRTLAASKLGISLRQIRYRIDRLHIAMPNDEPGATDGPPSGHADD